MRWLKKWIKPLKKHIWTLLMAYMLGFQRIRENAQPEIAPIEIRLESEDEIDPITDPTFFYVWMEHHAHRATQTNFRRV